MLIKSNSALMRQRLSNYAERIQTTSLQLVTDVGDHVIERLTHASSARPHTSTVTSQPFSLPRNSTGSLGEIDGQVYSVLRIHFESVFHSFGEARIQRTIKMMNWQLSSHLFQGVTESITDLTRHTMQQILTLPDPWCWAGKANSWTDTVPPFILTKPPSHP